MRKFGLIGYPLSHSFSRKYFTEKFEEEGIKDCVYENFSLPEISALKPVLEDKELCGLNVTIPYKEQVIPFLHDKSEVVRETGACNCIRIQDGRLTGHNTDVVGFGISMTRKLQPHHTQALILGTGGAAKAVEYVLRKLGISYQYVSRQGRAEADKPAILSYEQIDAEVLRTHTLLINTTPLGMYPKTEECPPLPYDAITPSHYLYDLVYNPARTLFLRKGEEQGAVVENGHDMLILQAEESWRIWSL
jgi:shikimate dehydrogenase